MDCRGLLIDLSDKRGLSDYTNQSEYLLIRMVMNGMDYQIEISKNEALMAQATQEDGHEALS